MYGDTIRDYIEALEKDPETYAENWLSEMRTFCGMSDEDIIRLLNITKKTCDIIVSKVN